MYALIFTNTLVFIAISCLHFYWALGGRAASASAIPTSPNGSLTFKPSAFATAIVGFGLAFFALITLSATGIFEGYVNLQLVFYANLAIALVFFMRAIGDFKYVGFSKKIKNTSFATNDTKYYTPLCLIISAVSTGISFFLHF